ncbi:MAG: hypothetical protein JWQ67_817 [Marmoricola sp.]|jgi:hypothetical protein|nr:hypothetical protein [Marmoricola sp.]MCW2827201.1 hypothetical protein [Marmoricola sp.]MCW2836533.1 hypothetical protein [Marmoricola sp.]
MDGTGSTQRLERLDAEASLAGAHRQDDRWSDHHPAGVQRHHDAVALPRHGPDPLYEGEAGAEDPACSWAWRASSPH